MIRKQPLAKGSIYHIYSRSIAGYEIFNEDKDYERFLMMLQYFVWLPIYEKFTRFSEASDIAGRNQLERLSQNSQKQWQTIAYCLMPTHFHLLLEVIGEPHDFSHAFCNLLNSYARYFNALHKRSGPLWSGRFKNVLVADDEYLLHLTRYIHLNPTSAKLVDNPIL